MLVRYPRLFPKGKAVDEMALNIDLAPTLLDLAGVAVPREMQGRSWVPLLTGKSTAWRTSFLAQYFLEQNFAGTPTVVGVRTATAKLIKYPGHDEWTELFDLAKDPYELKNLINDPASKSLLAQMQAEFNAQVRITGYVMPDYADKPGSPGDASPKKKQGKKKKASEG
jgi:arylsulfatase A-like enzyme